MISGVRASSIRIEVDLVDDGVGVAALHHVFEPVFHVVAQIVEAKLVVGAVGDVAVVLLLALLIVEAMHDHAGGETEEAIDLAHPFGVALGEIIVDGDDVDAAAGERVEIDRECRDQRLAFAGLHLRNPALVQHHAANKLDVEVALAERALACLAYGGESLDQNVVEGLAVGELLLEVFSARPQRLVGELFQLLFERIDGRDPGVVGADAPLVGRAEQLAGDSANHRIILPPVAPRGWHAFARSARVQAPGNTALFWLLQGDIEHAAMVET